MDTVWFISPSFPNNSLKHSGFQLIVDSIRLSYNHRDLEIFWQNPMKALGPDCQTVETQVGGPNGQRIIFTDDPENIKAILATQFDDYVKGENSRRHWKDLDRVSDLGTFEKHVQVLIKTIAEKGLGKEIEMFEIFNRFTLDVSTEFLLGRSVGNLLNPDLPFSKAFSEAYIKTINEFLEPFIDEVLAFSPEELEANSKKETNFLHSLAVFIQDRKVLRDQIMSVLLARRDTRSSGLSWLFYELARHPEVVHKLRAEIQEKVGLNQPTYSDLKNMKYLQHTMNESFRLYPSHPSTPASPASPTATPPYPEATPPHPTLALACPKAPWPCNSARPTTHIVMVPTSSTLIAGVGGSRGHGNTTRLAVVRGFA
ncbi:hypothetical protein G7Y89_g10698 [Cudoniella acicularis]|uniref:Cytochrome P450 n=1 Tax=Cudoniella acicularis TaxID=354080 RepID=A0A8H4VYS0_9HELO|nr:hypothetical protein G7Y89_g10698 [Cudoniella acicularis]